MTFADPFQMLVDSITDGIARGMERSRRQLGQWADGLENGVRDGLKQANEEVGVAVRKAVVTAYDERPKGAVSGIAYRTRTRNPKNQRFAGGRLRRALSAPDFFEATPTSLSFVNVNRLNKEARHWHRLAFGAAPEGQGSSATFPVQWEGMVAATLGFEEGPSPAFYVPRGFFVDPGTYAVQGRGTPGTGIFYPMSGKHPRISGPPTFKNAVPSRGLAARGFLDAGLAAMATELPLAYHRMYERVWDQATGAASA